MNRIASLITLALVMALLASCASTQQSGTTHYTVEYLPRTEDSSLIRGQPFNVHVLIQDAEVARTYARSQIVRRRIGPEFVYLRNHLWAVDFRETIPNLISERSQRYGLFDRVSRDFVAQEADYQVRSSIGAIEFISDAGTNRASVGLDLTLWDPAEGREVVVHRARSQRSVPADDVGVFVSEANELILDELDAFLSSVVSFLETGEAVRTSSGIADGEPRQEELPEGATGSGRGVLLLPAVPRVNPQPFFVVFDATGNRVQSSQLGEPVSLEPGVYSVELGTGSEGEQISIERVEVVAGRRTVVEPTWAAMTVEIVDTNREPVRVRYDVFKAETGQGYGGRISSSQFLTPTQIVWILPPDKYKVTINNQPFTALQDYVTLLLRPQQTENLTLVVQRDESGSPTRLVGGGTSDLQDPGDPEGPWTISSVLNGSVSFRADNRDNPSNYETSYFLDTENETTASFEQGLVSNDLENRIAITFTGSEGSPLRVSSDELSIENTFLYDFRESYGPFIRFDGRTSMVGNRIYPSEPQNYVKKDDGETVEEEAGADEVRLSPPFFPLDLSQGVGLNVNALRRARYDVSFRVGIGASQRIRNDTYQVSDQTETIDSKSYRVYEAVPTTTQTGIELSAFANARLPLDAIISGSGLALIPFGNPTQPTFELETNLNVVLVGNVSLAYRYILSNRWDDAGEIVLTQDHGVFLQLNYFFR